MRNDKAEIILMRIEVSFIGGIPFDAKVTYYPYASIRKGNLSTWDSINLYKVHVYWYGYAPSWDAIRELRQ